MFLDDSGHQAECHTCFQIYTADEETDGIQFGRDLPGAVCHGFGIGACLEPDENDPVTNARHHAVVVAAGHQFLQRRRSGFSLAALTESTAE